MTYESPSVDKLRVMTRHQLELYAWEHAVQRIKFEQIAANLSAEVERLKCAAPASHVDSAAIEAELDARSAFIAKLSSAVDEQAARIAQLERELAAANQLLEQSQDKSATEPEMGRDGHTGQSSEVRADEASGRRRSR